MSSAARLSTEPQRLSTDAQRLSTEPQHEDPLVKATRHLFQPVEYSLVGPPSGAGQQQGGMVTIAAFGLLGSICYQDRDCEVAYSRCRGSLCTCLHGYEHSFDRQTCVGEYHQGGSQGRLWYIKG